VADLPTQRDFDDFAAWPGRDVVGPDGERLGAVEQIFLDEATGVPEWVLVGLGDDSAFVPLAGASVEETSIRVDQDRAHVEAAPRPEPAETLSVGDERRLYEHYGLAYSQAESSTVLPEGAAVAEERPRLRKFVGAPVPAPTGEETPEAKPAEAKPAETGPAAAKPSETGPAAAKPSETGPAEAEPSETGPAEAAPAADRMAPRNLSSATPSSIPPESPRVIPPEGGFQAQLEPDSSRSRLRVAIPIVLSGAIVGLIAVLAYRRRS
jgi:PRC-barrel domain